MAIKYVAGGEKMQKALDEIARKLNSAHSVEVGFLENADYPDGTKVANVAATQNYGAPAASIPARPFFTNMVNDKAESWGGIISKALPANSYDAEMTMRQMGEWIRGQLQQSIRDMNSPALSPVTLAVRKWRKLNPGERVTGAIVGDLARQVAEGTADTSGVATKPLIDTAHMINSVDYEVK